MPLTVLDPRTGMRVTLSVGAKQSSQRRARNWVLRELDRLAYVQPQPVKLPWTCGDRQLTGSVPAKDHVRFF